MSLQQQLLNMTPDTAGSKHEETVKRSRCLTVQTGREKLKRFSQKIQKK